MWKIASRGFNATRCIITTTNASNFSCPLLPPQVLSLAPNSGSSPSAQKFISQSRQKQKKFDIKDHDDFDKRVINSQKPIVVNFHAEWCDPCKILTPKMIAMLEFDETVDLAIIDVENNTELVETFELKAVPAVIAFKNGQIVDKFIGLSDADTIEKLIQRLRGQGDPQTQ